MCELGTVGRQVGGEERGGERVPCLNSPSTHIAEVVKAQHYHALQSRSRQLPINYTTHLSAGSYLIHLRKKSSLSGSMPRNFQQSSILKAKKVFPVPPTRNEAFISVEVWEMGRHFV